ncbi:hypothetical protein HDU82_004140, partial [Entophlyctis luteolus]
LKDGLHNLCLYKYDKNTVNTADYLKWSAATEVSKSAPQLRDKMTIRTALCSTIMTQSLGILNLLHWHHAIVHFKIPVALIITQFRNSVPALEIVKFLHGILDALIEILDQTDEGDVNLADVVFNALVYVFGIIMEPRFASYEAALEAYVDKFLRSTVCWMKILSAFSRLVDNHRMNPNGRDESQLLCDAIRVWGFWIQLVVRSGLIDQKIAKTADSGSEDPANSHGSQRKQLFNATLGRVLAALGEFVGTPQDGLGEAQVLILRNLMELIPYLERVYGVSNLLPIIIGMIDRVSTEK